ncbi:MAG: MMPL family transporter, partial [Leptospiraceae bacterium]|nr:MMPL family transporter [Leptospiraceae bacterium]
QAGNLSINNNQIDLLPADYPEVRDTKRVVEMIGGNGFYTIVLKSNDEKGMNDHIRNAIEAKKRGDLKKQEEELKLAQKVKDENKEYYKKLEIQLKNTADRLNERLLKEEAVRYVSYRYDTEFLQDKFPLLVHPEDMSEVRKRINKKIDKEIEKLNPFNIDIEDEEEEVDFSDILNKYQTLAKRDMFEDYNISSDKSMLLMFVKPTGSFIDIGFTREFENKIKSIIDELKIREDGTFVGYTGTYKLNLDDYDSLVNALKPVSIASLLGIVILLLLFFRNPIFIIMLTVSLVSGVVITFGLTGVFIGRLNTITSVLAAVLMGLGIDYGIQFLYRFRQEFSLRDDFEVSIHETIYHTGLASMISAFTTTSAFIVLMFSDFKGFSEFGLIACYGIVTIALSMYFVTAIQISILLKYFPSTKKMFYHNPPDEVEINYLHKVFSNPNRVLLTSGIVILILGLLAFKVEFNYSGRDLLLENQESLLLYDEIGDRFDVSSDPQVIVVDTLEETEAIFDYFNPVPDSIKGSIDQVVSVWSMIPSIEKQKVNLFILKNIKEDIKQIKYSMLTEEQQKHYPRVMKLLEVTEFGLEELPQFFKDPFKEVPSSKIKGHMLFVYPKIALWHGKDLLKFYEIIGSFDYPVISKRTINILLHSEEFDFSEKENLIDLAKFKFTEEEEKIILEKANTSSLKELEEIGVLPLTAKFIVDHKPYDSIQDLRKHKNHAGTAGSVILFAKLAQIVQSEGYLAIIFTLLVVFFILLFFYKGILPAVISLVPLILGIVTMMGIMGITGIKINFMNILVFPIVIGYGIQNGIYIYIRYLEEKDIARTLIQVGPAIIASTLTTLVGWSALLLAEHRGLQSIGIAASIGIATTLIVALIVQPSLLEKLLFLENKKENGAKEVGMNFDSPVEEERDTYIEDLVEESMYDSPEIYEEEIIEIQKLKTSKKKSAKKTSKKKIVKKQVKKKPTSVKKKTTKSKKKTPKKKL